MYVAMLLSSTAERQTLCVCALGLPSAALNGNSSLLSGTNADPTRRRDPIFSRSLQLLLSVESLKSQSVLIYNCLYSVVWTRSITICQRNSLTVKLRGHKRILLSNSSILSNLLYTVFIVITAALILILNLIFRTCELSTGALAEFLEVRILRGIIWIDIGLDHLATLVKTIWDHGIIPCIGPTLSFCCPL
jgi:hypothetical protein